MNVGCSSNIDPSNPDARRFVPPPTSAGAMLLPSAYTQYIHPVAWRGYDTPLPPTTSSSPNSPTSVMDQPSGSPHHHHHALMSEEDCPGGVSGDSEITVDSPLFVPCFVPTTPYQPLTPEVEAIVFARKVTQESATSPPHFLPTPPIRRHHLFSSGRFVRAILSLQEVVAQVRAIGRRRLITC